MKYYGSLLGLGCFSHSNLTGLTGSVSAADSLVSRGLKAGVVSRVHRDLYCAVSLETGLPVANRWQIATAVSPDAAIVCHSAMEFYGFANQVFYEVAIASGSRFRDFTFEGVAYRRLFANAKNCVLFGKVRVTDLEQTVIDSIKYIDKCGGFEETVRCLALIPALDADRLLRSLSEYDSGFLYQKTGCLLSQFDFSLPESFFKECKAHIPAAKRSVTKMTHTEKFSPEWRLFCPSVSEILSKGVFSNVPV